MSIGLRGDTAVLDICVGDPRRAFSTSSSRWESSGPGVAVESSRMRTRLGRRSVRRRRVELPKSLRRSSGLDGDLSPCESLSGELGRAPDAQASRIGLTLLPGSRGAPNSFLRTAKRWFRSGRRCLPPVCRDPPALADDDGVSQNGAESPSCIDDIPECSMRCEECTTQER